MDGYIFFFISVRFGMMHVSRCLGVILLNPTTNKVTMMENLKDRFSKWKISHINPTAEQMIVFRKHGHKVSFPKTKYLKIKSKALVTIPWTL